MEGARVAGEEDLEVIVHLWQRAVEEISKQRGGALLGADLTRSDLRGALRSDLRQPDRILAVGTIDEVVVGFARADRRAAGDQEVGVVEIVFVEPAARQVGVGEAVLAVVSEWARDLGCSGLDAPALPGSRATKAFFEDHGFRARLLVMHHQLDEAV